MKLASNIAGALLGILFVIFGLNFFIGFIPMPPPPPADSPAGMFMGALFPTGYLAFVKALEVLGGALIAVPRTRNIGLLILGPIVVNILAFHVFILKGAALLDPVLIAVVALTAFLLWSRRTDFARLVGCNCGE